MYGFRTDYGILRRRDLHIIITLSMVNLTVINRDPGKPSTRVRDVSIPAGTDVVSNRLNPPVSKYNYSYRARGEKKKNKKNKNSSRL